jgi:imidazolonepropionase-like amidohydrolase
MHAYRADTAFDGTTSLRDGALVLVADGHIVGVESGRAAAPTDCPVSYFPDTTILPGLIDAHAHLCADGGPRALDQIPELTDVELDRVITQALEVELAVGVTTVRDLGDYAYAVAGRRQVSGPTVLASGPPITSVGGHCAAQLGGEVAGKEELRRAVRERAEHHVDVVKIMMSGGLMSPGSDVTACQFTAAELDVVVREAHQLGLPVTAHAHALAAVEMSVAAGVDGIEHATCVTRHGFRTPPELVAAIVAAGIAVCPTLGRAVKGPPPPHMAAFMQRTGASWEGRGEQVARLVEGGVTLISGGDSGINPVKPHGVLPTAIADLVTAGMPAADALASATSTAARVLGLGDRKGFLRAGHDADLLIVHGNPTDDIAHLRRVHTVVCGGVEHIVGSR